MTQLEKDEKDLFQYYINNIDLILIDKEYNLNIYKKLITYKICSSIEIIVRPECNQKCEYCYITNYGNELYPLHERKNKTELINNFQILIDYFETKKLLIPFLELFAGDLFYDNIIYDLLNILYNYYLKIYQSEIFVMQEMRKQNVPFFKIIIPSNFSFVTNEENLSKLLQLKDKFSGINVKLCLSASVDGKYATTVRENKSAEEVDKYYDKIFSAAFALQAGFHPMISPQSINTSIQNYDWWLEQLKKYNNNLAPQDQYDFQPMLLEVRDDNWTEENINEYINLLKHIIKTRLQLCNNSIELLTKNLFDKQTTFKMKNADIIKICIKNEFNEHAPCLLTSAVHINLNNMSIVPCHRLSYYQFIGGKFNIKDNKIIDITPINPSGYIGIKSMNFNYQLKCNVCPLNKICIKGCLGAQFESSGELFMPNATVCNLLKAKYYTLLNEYNNLGVLKELKTSNYISVEQFNTIEQICNYFNINLNLN